MQLSKSNNGALITPLKAIPFIHHGGGERNRTDDLLLAKQALSQLSYTPHPYFLKKRIGYALPHDGGPRKA
jgi:hypothetical protein